MTRARHRLGWVARLTAGRPRYRRTVSGSAGQARRRQAVSAAFTAARARINPTAWKDCSS